MQIDPEKLRRPDLSRFYSAKAFKHFKAANKLVICKPFPPFLIPAAPTWAENPHSNATWRLYYNGLSWLQALAFGLDTETDPDLRTKLFTDMKALVLSYLKVALSAENGSDIWDDHATAWRASTISYLYHKYLYSVLSEAEHELVLSAMREHGKRLAEFLHSGRWKASNHTIFQAEGLFDLTVAFPEQVDVETSQSLAVRSVRDLFAAMISIADGVSREHSMYYHIYDTSLLLECDRYFEVHGVRIFEGIDKLLSRMLEFYYLCVPSRKILPAIGDTPFGWSDKFMMRDIRSHIGTTDVIDYLETDGKRGAQPSILTCYRETGFYVFYGKNSGTTQSAIFLEKQQIGAHGHNDGNSFTLALDNEQYFIDSGGPYSYTNRLRHDYFRAAEAHNVLVVDETSRSYLTRIVAAEVSGQAAVVQGVADLDEGVRWSRWFVALTAGSYLLIDAVRATASHRFDYLYHLSDHLEVSNPERQIYHLKGKHLCEVQFLSDDTLDIALSRGGVEFPRSYVTSTHDQREPTKLLRVRNTAARHWCATLVSFDGSRIEMATSLQDGKVLRVNIRGKTEAIVQVVLSGDRNGAKITPCETFRLPLNT